MTPTSAPGSSRRPPNRRGAVVIARRERGFTLIELLVVLAIVALGAALITSALPDSLQSRLEEDGTRLSALLESARAQSRATGQAVRWEPTGDVGGVQAFRFVGLPEGPNLPSPPSRWLTQGVSAEVVGATAVVLGPEPVLPPQRIVLRLEDRRVVLASDGLAAFAIDGGGTP
jgi:general secretion pathway protein H